MKETIVSILEERMAKCTTEQFWAVATLSGMNAFVIAQAEVIKKLLPTLAILIALVLATGYGAWFIFHRHQSYYFLRRHLVRLLQDVEYAPQYMKTHSSATSATTLSGVVFYIGWVVGLFLISVIAMVK